MPRPRNSILLEIFNRNQFNQTVCTLGNCNGKILSTHSANLERHLKILHNELYLNYIKRKNTAKSNTEKLPKKTNEVRTRFCNGINKNNVELAIVELFTKNERPLEMIDDHTFKILLQPVFVALNVSVNSQNVNDMIVSYSQKLRAEINADLKGKLVSIKIDAVTKKNLSVLGINVFYIQNKCMTMKTLAIRELKESYTSEYIKSIIMAVLVEYSIDMNQILTISTDNGDKILTAVSELNAQLRDLLAEQKFRIDAIEDSLETSVGCSGRILELCVQNVLNTADIKHKLEDCRFIARKLRTRKYLQLFKYRGYKEALIDHAKSWISTYNMIERLIEIRGIIESFSKANSKFVLSSEIWCFMSEFIKTLNPLHTATKKLQSEQLCFSELYVIIMDLMFEIEQLPANGITRLLIAELSRRKAQLFENELFNAAVYLDPRIRICMNFKQIMRAKKYITAINDRISALEDMDCESMANSSHSEVEYKVNLPTSKQVMHKSFSDYLQSLDPAPKDNHQMSSALTKLEIDFELYERQSRIPLNASIKNFWNSQSSTLSVIADIILALPSTHNSVERLFSALKNIPCKQPNKIKSFNLEHLLLVKINGTFNYAQQYFFTESKK